MSNEIFDKIQEWMNSQLEQNRNVIDVLKRQEIEIKELKNKVRELENKAYDTSS